MNRLTVAIVGSLLVVQGSVLGASSTVSDCDTTNLHEKQKKERELLDKEMAMIIEEKRSLLKKQSEIGRQLIYISQMDPIKRGWKGLSNLNYNAKYLENQSILLSRQIKLLSQRLEYVEVGYNLLNLELRSFALRCAKAESRFVVEEEGDD